MDLNKRKERDKRQRARRACEFCSRRKIKCPGEEPSCSNCTAYGEKCVFKNGPKKPRPSNSRIQHLEEENRRLQKRLEQFESQCSSPGKLSLPALTDGCDQTVPDIHTYPDESSESANEDSSQSANHRPENSRKDSFEYHGPSSVLFEDSPMGDEPPDQPPGRDNSVQGCGQQRRLENLELSSSKADLDGIDPDLSTELLRLYWTRTNSFFMLVYRPAFDRSRSVGGPYFSKLLLNAMYFSASRYLQSRKTHSTQSLEDRFRVRFRQLLATAYDKSSITAMQALLIVSVSLSAVGKHRRLAWLYSGMAFRMLIDLGLHTNSPDARYIQCEEDIEINKRVFWAAFVIDKLQAFYHGRPACIQEADTTVPLVFHDRPEELEHYYPEESAQTTANHLVSNFLQICRLALIMNKVLNKIYREKSEVHGPEVVKKSLTQLNSELDAWQSDLPQRSFWGGENQSPWPPPQVYVILLMSQVTRILLHRPFVSYGHLQSVLPHVAKDSFSTCAVAANNIAQYLESYNLIHSFTLAPYFLFYASYVAATIHVRIAAQRHLDTNAVSCLRTCLLVFDMNSETNPAVKKAKAVIQRLMTKMNVKLVNYSVTQEPRTVNWPDPRIAISEKEGQTDVSEGQDVSIFEPFQHFDVADLDFDAILHSFSQPELGKSPASQAYDRTWSQAHATSSGAFVSSHGPDFYQNLGFPRAPQIRTPVYMEDLLFGFDPMAGPEDEW